MTNIQLAEKVIKELLSIGVEDFILCAGARNSPFVYTLEANKNLNTLSFFEERSASFFALGRAIESKKPVAIFTTSGTAVAELLPAAIEATYSSTPLIFVTSDRPKSYRGSGAPQTIEQIGIYSHYIETEFDLDINNSQIDLSALSFSKPIHINVCFDEPLIDSEISTIQIQNIKKINNGISYFKDDEKRLVDFCNSTLPLVILSTLPEKNKSATLEFLKMLNAPIYAEGVSGLKNHPDLMNLEIQAGEFVINDLISNNIVNSILKIGGVPTVRLWRDLEHKLINIPIFSVGYNQYSGTSREIVHVPDLDILKNVMSELKPSKEIQNQQFNSIDFKWKNTDQSKMKMKKYLYLKYPMSEGSLVNEISKKACNSLMYLGNSLPIRNWDNFADENSLPTSVFANRGANGIEGQISTFLGLANKEINNWCLVGDLTALYDLSSLTAIGYSKSENLNIIIMNNFGGKIFQRIFKDQQYFINKHELRFKNWAEMFGCSYFCVNSLESLKEFSHKNFDGINIIEFIPNENQNNSFLNEWEKAQK